MSGNAEAGALAADLFRHQSARLLALLTARAGAARIDDVEDAVQEALLAAMRRWPLQGVPAQPEAWLYVAARNALIDRLRRARFESPCIAGELPELASLDVEATLPDEAHFDDELLKLIVFCCHPSLSHAVQLALTLRLACGLGVEEIAAALLHLTAARIRARTDGNGRPVTLAGQDRSQWDRALIARGFRHLDASASGEALTRYHIEAAIAACHASAPSFERTDWEAILGHYEQLCALYPSPTASLGRLVALRHARGVQAAVAALEAADSLAALEGTLAWHATLASLYEALGEPERAAEACRAAADAAMSGPLREFFADQARRLSMR